MSDVDSSSMLLGKELFEFCKSESLSEEGGLHEIIDRYGWTPGNTHHINDYKFFRAACHNERVNEGIIQCLLEYFPDAAGAVGDYGQVPLHYACKNKSLASGKIITLLIDAAPNSVRSEDKKGHMPLHALCRCDEKNGAADIQILKLLIEKCPESVRHANNKGRLPIHLAAETKSPEFCRLLIEAYPGSERIPDAVGELPFHGACALNTIATVECLYQQYPDALDHATTDGHYPIHCTISSTKGREIPAAAVEIVRFLLDCDPSKNLEKYSGRSSLLQYACLRRYNHVETGIEIIKMLLDAHSESIRSTNSNGHVPLLALCRSRSIDGAATIQILKLLIEKFAEAVRHADDTYGNLPIHFAVETKSLKFCQVLIEAYPGSEQLPNAEGALPLHFACLSNSVAAVEYLYRRYPDAIDHATTEGFYPIHYAIDMDERDKPAAAVDVVRFLLDCDPNEKLKEVHGESLLHYACGRKYNESNVEAGIQIIETLLNAHPDSVRSEDNDGRMPLHYLCSSDSTMNEAAAIQILKLLIEKCPGAVRHADHRGDLPIHLASMFRSPEFCQVLIEAYPGSEQIGNANGAFPLHHACAHNVIATVEYLYRQYPEAINHVAEGFCPIHFALTFTTHRDKPAAALDIVRFLLNCDPNQKLLQFYGMSLLHIACGLHYDDSKIEAGIQIIKTLFDAHPEATEDNMFEVDIHNQRFHQQVQAFIAGENIYAQQAEDHTVMMTPDENGQLPLHRALQNNVRLGSIKLLVNGNPSAIRNSDNNFAMPLHIACEHHDSTKVIEYLLNLDRRTLRAVDIDNNTALHYACRGLNHDIIALLLEKYDATSVSKRNADGKLPIDLLWESGEVSDGESVEYMGSVFQLLRTNPEMLAISSNLTEDATRSRKKRKRNEEV